MCHCIFFRINPRVSKHHAFRHHRATVKSRKLLSRPLDLKASTILERNNLVHLLIDLSADRWCWASKHGVANEIPRSSHVVSQLSAKEN